MKTKQELLKQLEKLDLRLGKNVGAIKERDKIAKELTKLQETK